MDHNVALSLNSAFFGFYAHAGFMKGLSEIGFRPVKITGCSSGALVAGFYAVGFESRELVAILKQLQKQDFWEGNFFSPFGRLLRKGFKKSSGILSGEKLRKLLYSFWGDTKLEDLCIPLGISVSNLSKQKRELITRGSLLDAVMCSLAFPILFDIQVVGEMEYLDGGLVDGEPISELILDETVDKIISHGIQREKKVFQTAIRRAISSGISIINRETDDLKSMLAKAHQKELVRIKTKTPYIGPDDMRNGKKIIELARTNVHKNAQLFFPN
ncbi:MAG: patatin-like phospholipase family protein [Spirochaetota bacterium]